MLDYKPIHLLELLRLLVILEVQENHHQLNLEKEGQVQWEAMSYHQVRMFLK